MTEEIKEGVSARETIRQNRIQKLKAENIELYSAKDIKSEVKNVCDKVFDLVRNRGYKSNCIV